MSFFKDKWVFIDREQARTLGFAVEHGNGALVRDCGEDAARLCDYIGVDEDGELFWRLYDEQLNVLDSSPGVIVGVDDALIEKLYGQNVSLYVPCEHGELVAGFFGDPKIYDGIAIDLCKKDGTSTQCCIVEVDMEREAELHVLSWDGDHEERVHRQVVNVDGEYVF